MPIVSINNTVISDRLNEIEILLQDSKKWAAADPGLASQLATFIDVYLLGVIEESFELLVKQRASKSKDPEVENYIAQDIKHTFRNPCRANIVRILGKFSDSYATSFCSKFPVKCAEMDALDAVLGHKTNLAHKGTFQLGLTLEDVEKYLAQIVTVFETLEQILS